MDGIILLDKPAGMTSHDCVGKVRRLLKTKKVGHTGTLDPSVTGVLPICIGRATKLSQFLTAEVKEYLGEVTIGVSTTTEDGDGEIVETSIPTESITAKMAEAALSQLLGTSQQTPPMYSAVKVNGKKLYEYARAGQSVERPSREITIFEARLQGGVRKNEDGTYSFSFFVKGSKGLYVRTVATTLGEKLGYPAHMSHLRRTASGFFVIDDCLDFEQLQQAVTMGQVPLISMNEALPAMPRVVVAAWEEKLVRNGVALTASQIPQNPTGQFAIFNTSGEILAVYERDATKNNYISVRGLC